MRVLKQIIAVTMLSGLVTCTFAEDAPVYEVDNFPPTFESPSEVTTGGYEASASSQTYADPIVSDDQRLRRLEQQLKNLQHDNSSEKVDALQKEVATLRGQVEELTHQLQQAQNQQKAMFADVDSRLSNIKAAPAAQAPSVAAAASFTPPAEKPGPVAERPKDIITAKPAKSATPPPIIRGDSAIPAKTVASSQPNVAEEQQIYQTAYDLIRSKKYNEAINTLQKMLQRYPSGQSAANAHYWLGELYGLLNKNEQAATEFGIVVKNYPDSPKVSDAELKLGFIYLAQFKWNDAKTSFKNVVNRYPNTASARSASEQLKQIKQAGH